MKRMWLFLHDPGPKWSLSVTLTCIAIKLTIVYTFLGKRQLSAQQEQPNSTANQNLSDGARSAVIQWIGFLSCNMTWKFCPLISCLHSRLQKQTKYINNDNIYLKKICSAEMPTRKLNRLQNSFGAGKRLMKGVTRVRIGLSWSARVNNSPGEGARPFSFNTCTDWLYLTFNPILTPVYKIIFQDNFNERRPIYYPW